MYLHDFVCRCHITEWLDNCIKEKVYTVLIKVESECLQYIIVNDGNKYKNDVTSENK